MLCCLNPHCSRPQNSDDAKICGTCGSALTPRLRGRYRPTTLIGQGGFGRTYLATDEDRLGARCVIKQFSPQVQGAKSFQKAIQLFNQEAVRLFELGEHPQIPTLLAYFEQDNYLYLVQQFIEGQSLSQQLRRQGVFNESQIRSMLQDILPVLQFVHNRQVIHRDITPTNILRRQADNRLVLIDFGVAKQLSAVESPTGTRIGTEGYAPLEQFRSGKAYPASDLYSLGATCIYLMTDTRPDNLYDPLHGRWLWPHYLKSRGNRVSDRLQFILDKMLKDLVNERYQSADEILQDLEAVPSMQMPATRGAAARWSTDISQKPPPPPRRSGLTQPARRSSAPSGLSGSSHAGPVTAGNDKTASQNTIISTASSKRPASVPSNPPALGNSGTHTSRGNHAHSSVAKGGSDGCLFTLYGHTSWITCVAICPDDQTLVSSSLDDTVKLWALETGELLETLTGHTRSVNAIAISPDGNTLASGSDDYTIRIWNLVTRESIRTLTGHSRDVNAIAISPDARFLVSGGEDRTIRLWQLENGTPLRTLFGVAGMIKSIAVSPDGRLLVSGGFDNKIKLWSLQNGQQVNAWTAHRNSVNAVAISPDGTTLASGSKDRSIKLWGLRTGELLNTLTGHRRDVNTLAFTPDGHTLVSGSSDGSIKLWQLDHSEPIQSLRGHLDAISAIALSHDGTRIISGSSDKTIRIWKMPDF